MRGGVDGNDLIRRLGPGTKLVDSQGIDIKGDAPKPKPPVPQTNLTDIAARLERLAQVMALSASQNQESQTAALRTIVESMREIINSVQARPEMRATMPPMHGWKITPTRGIAGEIQSLIIQPIGE